MANIYFLANMFKNVLTKSFDRMVQISKVNPSETNKMDRHRDRGGCGGTLVCNPYLTDPDA